MRDVLDAHSLIKLEGVHPDLIKIVKRAIQVSDINFIVIQGLRSKEDQQKAVATGKSETLNSRHLDGHAVDLGCLDNAGKLSWDYHLYEKLAVIVKAVAAELKIPLEWGGDWKTIKDGDHFQLPWASYK